MAKQCMMRREDLRSKYVKKYAKRRVEQRAIINDPDASLDEKMKAQETMQKMPRDSSRVRGRNRCWLTGRGKGVYSFVGLCRNMFRIHAMQGDIPGLHKASW